MRRAIFALSVVTLAACGAATGLSSEVGDDDDDDTVPGDRGSCATRCDESEDCCAGSADCPGPFPRNWRCVDGFCSLGGCSRDDECGTGLECHPAGGIGICFDPCETDQDCAATPGATCRGAVDDGARMCGAFEFGCGDDTECYGWGVCDVPTGLCGCRADADCATAGAGCRF